MATAIITLLLLLSICASAGYLFNRYEDKQEKLSTARVGKFVITWDSADPFLLITHSDEPDRVLFQTLPGWPFLTIGYATDTNPPIVDGNFKVNEWLLYETPHQNIRRVSFVSDTEFVFIGEVWGLVTFATYEVKFHLPTGFDGSTLQNQLAFEANVQAHVGTFNRIFLNYWCDSKESFHGFGAQVN